MGGDGKLRAGHRRGRPEVHVRDPGGNPAGCAGPLGPRLGLQPVEGDGVEVGAGQQPVPNVQEFPPFPQSTEPSPPVPTKVSC